MYNSKQIEPFFNKVHKEANKAAQEVYDKYLDEAISRIKNQMGEGHIILSGMGVCQVEGSKNDSGINMGNEFFNTLSLHTQYGNRFLDAGFYLPSEIKK